MNVTSLQMKVGGALLALGGWASTQSTPWWLWKVGGLLNIIGALMLGGGRSNNVPTSAVPKAADADAQIKGDTKPPFPK